MRERLNLVDEVYDRLTVKSEFRENGVSYCVCDCICGNTSTVFQGHLRSGHTKSCGCKVIETIGNLSITHNKSGTKRYRSWHSMKDRCNNPNNKSYKNYGGRGISYCKSWENFESFDKDMAIGPDKGFTLDRINVDGNYEPDNCRWATSRQQTSNTRRNTNKYIGVASKDSGRYASTIQKDNVRYRLGIFDTELEAAKAYDDKCEEFGEGRPNGTNPN